MFPLVNGGHIFEDAGQKTEAIFIERILPLNINCCWFLFSSTYYHLLCKERNSRVEKKLKKLLVIIDISYVWTVNALARGTDIKAKSFKSLKSENVG